MPRNGAGSYSPPAADYPAVASTLIESAKYNNVVDDLSTAISNSIAANGETTVTANIPMNSKKLTGLAAGTQAGDSVRYEQLTKESIVGLTTADSPHLTAINLGHASDTTLTRVSAGVAAIEGVNILTTATGALKGANSDITSMAGLTTPLSVAQGGTGAATLTANNVLLGNTTSAPQFVAPSTSGNVLTSNGTTWQSTAPVVITNLTMQASTSGIAINFTGIPAGTKRITVMFSGVNKSGTSHLIVQIGDAGGLEATGYLGSSFANGSNANFTTGFGIYAAGAAQVLHGAMILSLMDATTNLWVAQGNFGWSDAAALSSSGGAKALSATLDRITVKMVNGTDTFVAGNINIQYE